LIRLLSGLILAAAALALIWLLSSPALVAVAVAVAALAFGEYARLVEAIGARVPWWTSGAATLAVCALVPFPWVSIEGVLAASLMLIALNVLASNRRGPPILGDTAAGVLAPVYIGLPLGCLVGVHAIAGREAVVLLIATVVVSDTAQYYTGRAVGRTPLAPRHSPSKTIEGAVGGLVCGPAFLAVAGTYWLPELSAVRLVALGVGVVAAGITGDLFESMLKRAAGVKDSGAIIPGHGGVLDRIDALLFAAPVFYFVLGA
jgi:phosphatidate cytidylyltransferase